MLQAIEILIPVVVAIISTFRWPTLERRVQRHVTLIKELPDGTGAPMRQLLEDELSALARRDRERLEAHEGLILFGFRLMLFVPLAASLIAAWRSGDLADDSARFEWRAFLTADGELFGAWIVLAPH